MSSRSRYALIALSALGLAASIAALYVHYRLLTNRIHRASATSTRRCRASRCCRASTPPSPECRLRRVGRSGRVSCSCSRRGACAGRDRREHHVRPATCSCCRRSDSPRSFTSSTPRSSCCGRPVRCASTMYVSVIGIFLVSAGAAGPLGALLSGLAKDLAALQRQSDCRAARGHLARGVGRSRAGIPEGAGCQAQQAAAAAAAPAVPVETLAPEQLTELHAWLDRQPTVPEAMPQGNVKVLLLKFNDYQCPSCRQAYILYKDIIAKYQAAYPGVFRSRTVTSRSKPNAAPAAFTRRHVKPLSR